MIKKPRKRGGSSPLEGCKIQPPMGVVAPGEKKNVNANGVVVTVNSTEATEGKEEKGVQLIWKMPRNFTISELKCVSF